MAKVVITLEDMPELSVGYNKDKVAVSIHYVSEPPLPPNQADASVAQLAAIFAINAIRKTATGGELKVSSDTIKNHTQA